jgi:hypothetical protein
MVTPSELDNLPDDVGVAPPEAYVDGSLPQLVPEGMYDLIVTAFDVSRARETKLPDGKALVLQAEVFGGEFDGRPVRNLRVWFTPFQRNGVMVSGVGDLIRAIDDTARWQTRGDAVALLQKAQDQRTPFRVKLIWEAFDRDYYADMGGETMGAKSPEQKALRKASTIRGMVNFKQAPDGTYLPEVEGPSSGVVEARLVIDRYVASSRRR